MVPIHQRFLSEAVNHKPDITPTTLWVRTLVKGTQLYDPREIAKLFGIHRNTVRHWLPPPLPLVAMIIVVLLTRLSVVCRRATMAANRSSGIELPFHTLDICYFCSVMTYL